MLYTDLWGTQWRVIHLFPILSYYEKRAIKILYYCDNCIARSSSNRYGVVAIDITIGKVMDRMLPKISNQGDTGKTYYSLNDVNTPVIIVGSSRAAHHYVTNMIEDSLRMSTYNVARDGCFFSYNCCVVNSIMDRYTPKLIIWENGTDYLYDGVPDPLESMYPYYGNNKWVKKIIKDELPWKEYVRLNSHMYQYNSIIHRVVMRYCGRNSFISNSKLL